MRYPVSGGYLLSSFAQRVGFGVELIAIKATDYENCYYLQMIKKSPIP
jgi:hypothetical protein